MIEASFSYAACPHCSGPVDVSRVARGAAIDVMIAVSFALRDSAVKNPARALDDVIAALREPSEPVVAEALWPIEEISRAAAVATQKKRKRGTA